ncbi:YjgB family protein [Paenibacillus glycanilyticus]|uniref:YjgB family protein n=1 Tax=Paenibacillus glycanilyticus TaxID=126569 RepID=UPI0020413CEE|nr:YjgB family protein [Paenibacillus glycanilyticus]MCM3628251.1 YjgB family protein [Paenibacillus glycanilyticus]
MMKHASKMVLIMTLSGLLLAPGITAHAEAHIAKKSIRQMNTEDAAQALRTLNSFYKPALTGQFPGSVNGLKVGVSTRKDVINKIGQPDKTRTNADGFDLYHAEMGHPGYAVAYKLNKVREIRYFGTNIERQTNIGGITKRMLLTRWGKPSKSVVIRNGSLVQQKIVYKRGKYNLAFIFNSSTNLDHINLLKR